MANETTDTVRVGVNQGEERQNVDPSQDIVFSVG